jgi:hypothetical protein
MLSLLKGLEKVATNHLNTFFLILNFVCVHGGARSCA